MLWYIPLKSEIIQGFNNLKSWSLKFGNIVNHIQCKKIKSPGLIVMETVYMYFLYKFQCGKHYQTA